MPSETLTVRGIENTRPPKSGRLELWDAKEVGLILRVSATGAKTWAFQFKSPDEFDGRGRRKTKKLTLGPYPEMSLSAARDRARKAKSAIADGVDPASAKVTKTKEKRTEAQRLKVLNIAEAVEEFADRQSIVASKWKQYETPRLLRTELAKRHGSKGIGEIEPADLRKIRDAIHRRAPIMSNRFVAASRAFFKWVASEYDLPDPSAPLVARVDEREHRRERYLSTDELRAVWAATGALTSLSRDFVRMLMLTPHRESLVAGMRRSEINAQSIWLISRYKKKQKVSEQKLPLSERAQAIVAGRPIEWDHLFCSGRASDQAICAFSKIKRALDSELGGSIEPWKFHDLRRSFATWAAEAGVDQAVTRRILDHKQGFADPLEAIYNQHQYIDEQRSALNEYAEVICG